MRKLFFTSTYLFFSILYSYGADQTFRALVRLEKKGETIKIQTQDQRAAIPAVGMSKEIRNKISELQSGSEAFIDGTIQYTYHKTEGTLYSHPVLMIHDIHPISLKQLGLGPNLVSVDRIAIGPVETEYIPQTIPITTEVASAITLTTSLLLMNELTSTNRSNSLDKDLTTTLFLSSGLLATIILIYDQIEGKNKP